ncbi:MAG: acyloxyacyl hydrolase [Terracidiphilus sp.]
MLISRRIAYFCVIVMTLHFSQQSIIAQEANKSNQGEAGLSTRPWQWGGFVQGGFPPGYQITTYDYSNYRVYFDLKLQLLNGGLEAGKQTRRFEGLRPLRGRGEAMLEVMPFWLARYPPQPITLMVKGVPVTTPYQWNGNTFHGASVTPFLLRWNFSQRDSARIVPWTQLGGGLLWTNHKFPLDFNSGEKGFGFYSGTSVINFTPQVGAGVNVFNRPKHSINLALKAIHISNASLGDHNPGLNQTLQFSLGYSWWR